jgi:ATP-dependent Clp protease ATP-binding subunit ClpC
VIKDFSSDARRALAASEREARLLKHPHVATEHLLLGLLCVEDSIAARALRSLGVRYGKARRQIARLVDSGADTVAGPVAFTPRAREIMEDAFSGSTWLPLVVETSLDAPTPRPFSSAAPRLRASRRREVQTDELLFALLAHGEGVAAHVLNRLGIDLEKLAIAVHRARVPEAPENVLVDTSLRWPPGPAGRN